MNGFGMVRHVKWLINFLSLVQMITCVKLILKVPFVLIKYVNAKVERFYLMMRLVIDVLLQYLNLALMIVTALVDFIAKTLLVHV
jgi:hypothetical protein